MAQQESQNNKTADKLLREIYPGNSSMRPEFREELKNKVLARCSESRSRDNFFKVCAMFFSSHARKLLLSSVLVCTFALLLGGGAYGYLNMWGLPSEDDLLQNVLGHNSMTNNSADRNKGLAENSALAATDMMFPIRDFKYSHTVTTYEYGDAKGQCPAVVPWAVSSGSNLGRDESWDYFDEDDEDSVFYTKYQSFDTDGHLVTYSLQTEDGWYEYRGGQYAVKTLSGGGIYPLLMTAEDAVSTEFSAVSESEPEIMDEPVADSDSDSADTSSSDQAAVESVFGPDVEIVGRRLLGGKFHYVIDRKEQSSCELSKEDDRALSRVISSDGSVGTSGDLSTTVIRLYVEPETYSIARQEWYLGSVKEKNLIFATETSTQKSDDPFSAVSAIFIFDYSVPVKEIDTSSETTHELTLDMLREENVPVIVPLSDDFTLMSLYTDLVDSFDYVYDRAYYPSGRFGDDMYEEATAWMDDSSVSSVLSMTYAMKGDEYVDSAMDIYIFEEGVTDSVFFDYAFYGSSVSTGADTIVDIAGTDVSGRMVTVTYPGGAFEPSSTGSEESAVEGSDSSDSEPYVVDDIMQPCDKAEDGCESVDESEVVITFDFGGYTYYVVDRRADNSIDQITDYSMIPGSDTERLQVLMDEIDTWLGSDYGIPVMENVPDVDIAE